jgi:hypothetical protein
MERLVTWWRVRVCEYFFFFLERCMVRWKGWSWLAREGDEHFFC